MTRADTKTTLFDARNNLYELIPAERNQGKTFAPFLVYIARTSEGKISRLQITSPITHAGIYDDNIIW